jgi:DNA-binding response OmpR family regulator
LIFYGTYDINKSAGCIPARELPVKKILVVEDDESQRLLYHDELVEAGYEVMLAAMETLGRIIREYRDVPVILNTAYSSYRDEFMSWGADAYVVKSADLGELKAKVRQIIGGPESHL